MGQDVTTPEEAAKELAAKVAGIKAPMMDSQTNVITAMAKAAKPIMDNFQKVLVSADVGTKIHLIS